VQTSKLRSASGKKTVDSGATRTWWWVEESRSASFNHDKRKKMPP
jgi:hypothetical protein